MQRPSIPVVIIGERRFAVPQRLIADETSEQTRFDRAVFLALVARGIQDNTIPTSGRAAGFPVVAAVVRLQCGEVLATERLIHRRLQTLVSDLLWEELWHACEQPGKLPSEFRAVLLRLFRPFTISEGLEPRGTSRFVELWDGRLGGDRVSDTYRTVGYVSRRVEISGLRAYARELSGPLRQGVEAVAQLMPEFLVDACRIA